MPGIHIRDLGEGYSWGARVEGLSWDNIYDEAVRADLKRLFEDGKLLYAYDRAKGLPPREVTNYFLDAIEAVRHNKQRYAEAERAARARRPIRPTYYDQGPGADDDAMPF